MGTVENFGCWKNGCNPNTSAGTSSSCMTSPWLHTTDTMHGAAAQQGSKSQCPGKCPSLSSFATHLHSDSWCLLQTRPPIHCWSLTPAPYSLDSLGLGRGVPMSICMWPRAPMLDCVCASLRGCVCVWKEVVYVAGVAARSWKVLKVGVLVVVGGWLLFGWV